MSKENKLGTDVPKEVMTVREKQCTVCGATKPKKEFLKRLTLAQTRAFLKQPNATTRFTATSKVCTECRNKTKRRKPLTAKEIRSKISSGDMSRLLGEMKLEQLRQTIPHTRSKVMKQYWEGKKSEPYKQLKRYLQDQLNRYGNRHFASKNLQDATREQNRWNYEQAKLIVKDLLDRAQSGETIPPLIQIASLIPPKPQGENE